MFVPLKQLPSQRVWHSRIQRSPGPACYPEAASSREFNCVALSADRGQYEATSGPYARTLGPTTFGHRPTHPAIVRPGVQHRLTQCGGASGYLGGSWQQEACHHHKRWGHQSRAILVTSHTKLTQEQVHCKICWAAGKNLLLYCKQVGQTGWPGKTTIMVDPQLKACLACNWKEKRTAT